MNKNIFKLFFKLLIVAFVVTGICLTPAERSAEQFWFFTLQTNIFVALIQIILSASLIFELFGKELKFTNSLTFSRIRILSSFFITITGFVYCFILAPCGIIFDGMSFLELFDFRNVLLHIVVPVMAIADYLFFCNKGIISYKQFWLFLIYPFVYSVIIYLRVAFGGKPFFSGSYYPYFFFDPFHKSQGLLLVAIYLTIMALMFTSLAMMYIWIDKRIANKQNKLLQRKKSV